MIDTRVVSFNKPMKLPTIFGILCLSAWGMTTKLMVPQ